MLMRWLRSLHTDLKARFVRHFRIREVIHVLENSHQMELANTPGELWPMKKREHIERVQAVAEGKLDIIDRRSWAYPYLPEALHRLNQPILKNTPYNLRRFCFSDDTEVLTKRGWIPWPQVTERDEFITYNVSSGQAEWQKPEKIFKYWYQGKMYSYQNKFVDKLVTPDHFLLGRYRKSSNYWNGKTDCPECGKKLKTPQAMGSHRRKIHGIPSVSARQRAQQSYTYSSTKLERAWKVEKFQNKFASSVYAFEVPLTATWKGKFPKSFNPQTGTISVGGKPINLLTFVKFMGIFIAEGSCRGTLANLDLSATSKKPHYVQAIAAAADTSFQDAYISYVQDSGPIPYQVRISQTSASEHNSQIRRDIEKLLHKLPWIFKINSQDFSIVDAGLHEYLFKFGNSYTKRVPRWLKNLPPMYLREFIKWAVKGDGHVGPDGHRSYSTVSCKLADDMQEIFQRSGTWAQIHVNYDNGTSGFNKEGRQAPLYTVSEHRDDWGGLPKPEHIDYKGYVYCASLPNKTVYVRRNGKPCWSGRSETPIPRRAINLIKNTVMSLRWNVLPEDDADGIDTPEMEKRIRILTDVFRTPNKQDSYRSLFEAVFEDILIGGYGCLEPRMTPYYKRPLKMWAVDGSTVRIFADWSESTPDKPRYAQMTGLKGERGIVAFLDSELIYIKDNNRTSTPFGLGKLEIAFNSVNALLSAQDMSARAAGDQIHKTLLWWSAGQNTANLQTVRRMMQNEMEGQAKIGLMTNMPKPEVIDLQPVQPQDLLLDWQMFLIKIIANAFDLSPIALGIDQHTNRATSQTMADADFRSSIVPMATRFQEEITRKLIHGYLGWEDLKFEFSNLDDPDAMTKSSIQQRKYLMNAITPDEMREDDGLPPLAAGWGRLTAGQIAILTAAATAAAKGGAGSANGMPKMMGLSSGSGMNNLSPMGSGFGSGTIGAGSFSPDSIAMMSPEDIEYLQQSGMLPPTGELGDQMEQQQPGILESLTYDLKDFFDVQEELDEENEIKPQKVSKSDEKGQQRKFRDSEHVPLWRERVINDRGAVNVPLKPNERQRKFTGETGLVPRGENSYGGGVPQQTRKQRKERRGKYPRNERGY